MAKLITRTFFTSVIHAAVIVVENDAPVVKETFDVTVDGKIDDDKAKRLVSKQRPNDTVVVTSIDYTGVLRGITREAFIENSVVIEKPSEDDKPTDDDAEDSVTE